MKKLIAIFSILLSMTVLFSQDKKHLAFTSVDLDGNSVTEAIFTKNKLTMLNIWGTFCPPCIREMPDLAKLSEAYKDKGFQIIGLAVDASDRNGNVIPKIKTDALRIIEKTGANYTHIVPSKEMMNGFLRNVQAVPTTYFIDSQGNFISLPYLGAKSYSDWQQIVDSLLAKQK